MELNELNELAEELKEKYGLYYAYDENDKLVHIYDGTPYDDTYERYYRIYINIETRDIWIDEFSDANSYIDYGSHIIETSIDEILKYLKCIGYDDNQYFNFSGDDLNGFLDDIIEFYSDDENYNMI